MTSRFSRVHYSLNKITLTKFVVGFLDCIAFVMLTSHCLYDMPDIFCLYTLPRYCKAMILAYDGFKCWQQRRVLPGTSSALDVHTTRVWVFAVQAI